MFRVTYINLANAQWTCVRTDAVVELESEHFTGNLLFDFFWSQTNCTKLFPTKKENHKLMQEYQQGGRTNMERERKRERAL